MLRKLVLQVLDAQRESVAAPERSARLRGMRVLVVEDNRINQRVMQNMLVGEGARVWLAENGQQGVDAIRENLDQQFFDVVLMDLQMPVMDGYQACREIRNSLALKHLPLIAVSANVQAVDRAQSLAAGFNVHIGKPFVLDEVVAVIQQLTNMASATTTGKAANVPHVYWIRNQGQDIVPDATQLLQQGIALHVLNSIHEWAERTVGEAHSNSLLVVDMATATSTPMRTLLADNVACMKPGAWLVRSDEATENAMQTSMRAGAVDWAALPYACEHMVDIVKRHFDAHGGLRLDPNNKVVAIDSHAAMTRTFSDPGFFGSLLRAFSDELPDRLKGLLEDVVDNPVQFRHRAHSLKGLAVSLGLMSLHQIASQAEGMASQAGRISKAQLMVELEGEIQSARFQILRWLDLYGQSVEDTQ
jgi:CheY-like chemotaxis protein/HPt (histidine-containing phosphotransfer) domain-containing protein